MKCPEGTKVSVQSGNSLSSCPSHHSEAQKSATILSVPAPGGSLPPPPGKVPNCGRQAGGGPFLPTRPCHAEEAAVLGMHPAIPDRLLCLRFMLTSGVIPIGWVENRTVEIWGRTMRRGAVSRVLKKAPL